jgi:hypothetical protein
MMQGFNFIKYILVGLTFVLLLPGIGLCRGFDPPGAAQLVEYQVHFLF